MMKPVSDAFHEVPPTPTETHFLIAKEGFVFISGCGILTLLAVWVGAGRGVTTFLGLLTLFCTNFFRDPKRCVPVGENLLVSPGDGKVVDVSRVDEGRFLKTPAIKVSIFLNVFDVHVNRAPVAGKVIGVFYNPGKFFAADVPKASLENEQNALLIETPSGQRVVCIQIAGLIARRIVCRIREGMSVRSGERFGLIRFGSRVDLYFPVTATVQVAVGERVRGGETVIGVLA
jgi:phosphatidylserine decarboxylase